ncbi:hypothetical protein [Actinomadura madurae]|uniref:hypothetical protein n=1 Tax=Actinomadura madurae TaxID=1993 RepID=UPI0020D21BDD|nr:hypothetical protein [Actinomadura madurae]MCQ0015620.1 hypothetical protein [Actinomadura madurae]
MNAGWVIGGRFTMLDRIGSGGTSRVWRAYDRVERRYCAAKLVRQPGPTSMLRVVRERALRLAHPHVLTPYASCMAYEDVLLAMDLVRGGRWRRSSATTAGCRPRTRPKSWISCWPH